MSERTDVALERIADALEVLASAERRRMARETPRRRRKSRQHPKPKAPPGPRDELAAAEARAALKRAGVTLVGSGG